MRNSAPVDNYLEAYPARAKDVRRLIKQDRRIAAQHLGGITVECILKAGIVYSQNLTHWPLPSNSSNPRHDLNAAVGLLPDQVQAALAIPSNFTSDLQHVQTPPGTNKHYIHLRYHGLEPPEQEFEIWREAYHFVVRYLHKIFELHLGRNAALWGSGA